jgi:outer membrane protein TolC
VANYQNTVLEANEEVEDALVAFLNSQKEVELFRENVDDLERALTLLLIQFEEGAIDFSPIFVLQGSLRTAQDQLAAAQGRVLVNLIDVYRALGGGWRIRCPGFRSRPILAEPEQETERLPPPEPQLQSHIPAASDRAVPQ